ncbi:L-aminoadipate-semialdehyde dehydrogenase [Guyanagaster necrorhizus]|uniref:L-aminoadipate-semialdehyde dehydrogenase n=1 Tax=Guyanagaster necrorhizus TaxID=856835 RepID=A0A9P7VQ16_9AGAR|nr:L-aminoadipate-semialdehyde dehydrogenase [Guyanagaster necrorhizus MCA 3950]KAG7444789.1 L-aminoadipate-semialdehyde dehydrogenase [Guyanagaster necrorhizus MCA 3950]
MPAVTFKAKSITELVAIRARDQPNDPAIYTGSPEDGFAVVLRSLTFSQIQSAVDRLAWHYYTVGLASKTAPGEVPPAQTIAVLTSTAIDESLLEMALAKLGLTALLLSVNNSVPAVAHLTKLTNATHLIYGTKFIQEAHDAQRLLRNQGYSVELVEDKRFPLWGSEGVESTKIKPFPAVLTPEQETKRPAVILHSSGSTGFPKPVRITHYGLIANVALNQNKPGFSTLPVFHGYGHFAVFRCIYPGQPLTLFPPHLPLTSSNICAVLAASPPIRQCYAVPYVIKLLAETPEGVNALASFDIVGYAGAPLPDDLGDRLVQAGVNLLSIYGTTETGSLMNSNRDFSTDKLWNWTRPLLGSANYLVWEPQGGDTFEVIVKDGYPPKIETNRPDGSYATKDLFLRHPERKDLYKYIGRLDDTLVHILGEKTNPVPMELCIRGNSPYVAEAIVFGAGKPQTGCLILPSDLANEEGLSQDELMSKVWPVIEQANAEAPTHSRLLPEMVEFLPYDTAIPVATKMSILRSACYSKFKDLIENIYARFDQTDFEVEKKTLPREELEAYIFDTIAKALGPNRSAKLDRKVDLFAFGVDSLQATRIRNSFQKELELETHNLRQTVVYEHPSVEKLADYILRLQSGVTQVDNGCEAVMLALLDKWGAKVGTHTARANAPPKPTDRRVILLTGATGSLGAHILSQLTASFSVGKVVCLSRAKSHAESLERVRASVAARKVSVDETKVTSYGANANEPLLGLTAEEYGALRDEVTDVIHNAWPVNFVLNIESYDTHIGGAVNLINLCLESPFSEPASFAFSSSVSCRQGSQDETCSEGFSPAPSTAAGTGYAQSKWVVEKLCERATEKSRVPVSVLRIGQMVGDSVHGVWNETEAWPLMFKSANTVGALPVVDEHPSWLPVDFAGKSIAEVVLSTTKPATAVYHIVNPNTSAHWKDILAGLEASGVSFERVDKNEWVERLAKSDADGKKNPVIKLLPFFRMRYGPSHRAPMVFLTEITTKITPTLKQAPVVDRELVAKWVAHWRTTGFIN